jgi:hypothetical protein
MLSLIFEIGLIQTMEEERGVPSQGILVDDSFKENNATQKSNCFAAIERFKVRLPDPIKPGGESHVWLEVYPADIDSTTHKFAVYPYSQKKQKNPVRPLMDNLFFLHTTTDNRTHAIIYHFCQVKPSCGGETNGLTNKEPVGFTCEITGQKTRIEKYFMHPVYTPASLTNSSSQDLGVAANLGGETASKMTEAKVRLSTQATLPNVEPSDRSPSIDVKKTKLSEIGSEHNENETEGPSARKRGRPRKSNLPTGKTEKRAASAIERVKNSATGLSTTSRRPPQEEIFKGFPDDLHGKTKARIDIAFEQRIAELEANGALKSPLEIEVFDVVRRSLKKLVDMEGPLDKVTENVMSELRKSLQYGVDALKLWREWFITCGIMLLQSCEPKAMKNAIAQGFTSRVACLLPEGYRVRLIGEFIHKHVSIFLESKCLSLLTLKGSCVVLPGVCATRLFG